MSYIANAALLVAGSIVQVEKPLNFLGKPTYPHFFIVLSPPSGAQVGDILLLVGISSRVPASNFDPTKHVAMKWLARPGGDPETGFSKPCYACMDFVHVLEVYAGDIYNRQVSAEYRGKFIRAEKLQAVIAVMNAWNHQRKK